MVARFLLLKNNGSPTRWDGTRYVAYARNIRDQLPDDLKELTRPERFMLPSGSDLSLWHSDVRSIQVDRDRISLSATNDYGTRHFEFVYSGVKKVQTTSDTMYYMPSIVMQELFLMPDGLLRHTFSDLGDRFTTIYSTNLSFAEHLLQ